MKLAWLWPHSASHYFRHIGLFFLPLPLEYAFWPFVGGNVSGSAKWSLISCLFRVDPLALLCDPCGLDFFCLYVLDGAYGCSYAADWFALVLACLGFLENSA